LSDKDFKVKNKLIVNGLNNASGVILSTNNTLDSHSLLPTQYGGTGTTTSPTTGQIPYSSAGATYSPVALTTLDVKGSNYSTSAPSSPVVGQVWIQSDSTSGTFDPNIIRRQAFTATAGQTVFTTTVAFVDTYEQVFFNGMLLLRTTDYTTSGNNTITLTSAAAVNDIVEVVTVTNLNSTNTYTQAEINSYLDNKKTEISSAISANTTLVAGRRYYVTSASALTLTLPASPAQNDQVDILNASGNAATYNITIARNSSLINGNAGNFIIDANGYWATLVYTGATYGWKVG
jgi:hypothetical protein